jgi:hypothetical protein
MLHLWVGDMVEQTLKSNRCEAAESNAEYLICLRGFSELPELPKSAGVENAPCSRIINLDSLAILPFWAIDRD